MFSSLVLSMNKIKISKTTVWRYQESGQNKTKIRDGRPKAATRSEDKFSRVSSLHDRRLTAPNITAQLNQCHEKMYQHPLTLRRPCEAGLYGKIVKKQSGNKVFWTDKSKSNFVSNRRVYLWQRVGERAATSCITLSIRHGKSSIVVSV